MHSDTSASPLLPTAAPRASLWLGRGLSALPVLALLASAAMKLSAKPEMVATFTGKFGYPQAALVPIALAELACAVLFAIPRTAVLGAILMTGYLGGAVATHVRAGEPFVAPLALGVLAWAGLWLRDRRVKALAPLRAPLD